MKDLFATTSHLSQEQIKSYLAGTLDDEARFAIENHLLDCSLCSAAVEGFSESYDFETDQMLETLARRFSGSEEAAEAQIRPLRRNYSWLNRIAVAAAILILPLATWMYWNAQQHNRLYNQYFESYTSDYLSLRGNQVEDIHPVLEKAMTYYQDKNYSNSLPFLENYLKESPENTIAAFHAGMACLEIGQLRKAIQYLDLVRLNDEQYYEDATWYLVLAHLQLEEKEEVKVLLTDLLKLKEGYYEQEAKELMQQLPYKK